LHKFYDQELHQSPLFEPWWEEPDRRLPLVIVGLGLKPAECAVHGGQVDIAPTLLDLLGLEGERGFMGRSLVTTRRDVAVLVDGTLKGRPANPEEARQCAQGLAVADQILRGDYFRTGD
jgi:phosphoglycerol transferase MdoB-like AlkP superfamily enzyme